MTIRYSDLLLVALLLTPYAIADVYEPDNSFANATWLLTNGTTQLHSFDGLNDTDYVRFNVTQGRTYLMNTYRQDAVSDTVLEVYFPDQTTLLAYNDDDMGTSGTTNSRILFTAPQTGTFYGAVTEYDGDAGGNYTVQIIQMGVVSVDLLSPTSDQSANENSTFVMNATVACSDGPCGTVKVTLDPQQEEQTVDPLVMKEIAERGEAPVLIVLKPRRAPKAAQYAVLDSLDETIEHARVYDTIPVIAGTVTEEAVETLLEDSSVAYIEYDAPVQAFLTSSSPSMNVANTWAVQANGVNITGDGVTVCVIDSGIAYDHADFGSCSITANINDGSCAKVVGGINYCPTDACSSTDDNPYDNNGHGSHVAGTVASMDSTYRGVAPGAKLVAVKALNSAGGGSMSDVIAGIDWCVANATRLNISVITMSLGADVHNANCDRLAEAAAINAARAAGILVTVAAGNDFTLEPMLGMSTPACVLNSTSVGATNDAVALTSFTKRDVTLDIFAPGQGVTATDYEGGHMTISGTSMATPHVAGAAALYIQYTRLLYGRNATPDSIEHVFKSYSNTSVDTSFSNLSKPRINLSIERKGDVPMTVGARPFWTPSTNPTYCTLANSTNCTVEWTVNATGPNGTFEFFIIAENNYSYVESARVNITVIEYVPPPTNVTITKTVLAGAVFTNETANFTITVSSNDTMNRSLTVADVFNASLWNFTNASVDPNSTAADSLRWHINLTGNTSWSVNVSFAPLLGGALVNYVGAEMDGVNLSTASSSVNATVSDNTAPNRTNFAANTVTKDSASLSFDTDENATCGYSASDVNYSAMTAFSTTGALVHSVTFTGLNSSTQYTYYARCMDGLNNTNTDSVSASFTTSAASSGGGGGRGGGGGGGGAPRTTAVSTQRSWDLVDVNEGSTHELHIGRAAIPMTDIEFTAVQDVGRAAITVKKQSSAPVRYEGSLYTYIAVDHPDALVAEDVTLTFTVDKDWLAEQDSSSVEMLRLEDGVWNALPTRLVDENASSFIYRAQSPGLSYFAIAVREQVLEQPVEEEPVLVPETVPEPVEEPAVEPAVVVPAVEDTGSGLWTVLSFLLMIAFAAGMLTIYVIYTQKRR